MQSERIMPSQSIAVVMTLFVMHMKCTTTHAFQSITNRNSYQPNILSQTMRFTHGSLILHAKSTKTNHNFVTPNTSTEIGWKSRTKCWRPTIQDVENISWGKPAKKKGTGSRGVPHRLNHEEERKLFDQARNKGFLEVVGSGWRSQRGDAPLLNTYRSLCDARGQVCIVLHKGSTGIDDELVVDLSPLRLPETFDSVREDLISIIDLPIESNFVLDLPNLEFDDDDDTDDDDDPVKISTDLLAWEERPIYQLSPYCVSWITNRSEGKSIGKKLASIFNTAEPKTSASKKPKHVKHGKNRRSGGYGIG